MKCLKARSARGLGRFPDIAKPMNGWFVNVKVDREERPDIDAIYMVVTQLLTGSGGWPNSVFLTPDLEPFFAGTHFPPEDVDRRSGFPTVMAAVHRAWEDRRTEVEVEAERLAGVVAKVLEAAPRSPHEALPRKAVDKAVTELMADFDAE